MAECDPLMLAAARLRTHGKSWDEVAEVVDRAVETMRSWSYKRADEWRIAMVTAIDEVLPILENEALKVCKAHLATTKRTSGEKRRLAQTAARDLLRHARELRGIRMKHEISGPGGGPLELFAHLSATDLAEIVAAGEEGEEGEHDADTPDGE